MTTITANELKTQGISVLEKRLGAGEDVIISVRGVDRFVVMSLEKYHRLREFDLELALQEARADYTAGRVVKESVEDHLRRLTDAP